MVSRQTRATFTGDPFSKNYKFYGWSIDRFHKFYG